MGDKVLLEYRLMREEGGYRYEFHRAGQRFEIKSSAPFHGIVCWPRGVFWAGCLRRFGRYRGSPRRAAQKTLDALERMYRDIYGAGSAGAGGS